MDIIIGSGMSGLTYASKTSNEYIILEADSKVGGYCKTIKKDGFVWDYSGHFFHFQNRDIEEYVFENISVDEILKCIKHTQIFYKGNYIDFPFQKNIHQLSKEDLIECLYDLFVNPYVNHSSFKEMLYAKFGKSIAESFLVPYNQKLYACDLDTLDSDAMGRFFPYAEKEEIIANFKKSTNNYYNSFFIYPKGGAIQYINSLMKRINNNRIFLNEQVVSIDLINKKLYTNKRSLEYTNIISTIPFNRLLAICNISFDATIYSWNKVLVFNLGFNKKGRDIENNWIYFPGDDVCFYRVGYYDNIFGDSRMSLYVELGFPRDAFIDKKSCLQQVLEDLTKVGIVENQQLIAHHSVIMDPAYVHISKDSQQDVKNKKRFLKEYNIYSIGRYGSWTYCSIEDGMKEAVELAKKLQ
ncbi:FAD-dependent oxidoreductase [Akkermansia sp. N21169]|uniref:protoporphyrinogen/coproporphyrinogen oxidase n=1 Tax=Akkermansia sp. N21169 TaxID=3040765 RepID=UPI00244E9E75|nr:FAD-dependent oxidoreductase [Akkermansia sp. N21169]MDH3069579.1 FAD-dependent oxidoreductase [Akkermansia sp. N21169]